MDMDMRYAGSSPNNFVIQRSEDVNLFARLPYSITFSSNKIAPLYDLGRVQYITITSHVDVVPVRKPVRIAVAGFTNSTGTVAGTIMYPVTQIHAFANIMEDLYAATGYRCEFVAELPPLDIIIFTLNPQGQASIEYLEHVKFPDSGVQISSDGMEGVERYTFVARRYVPKYMTNTLIETTESEAISNGQWNNAYKQAEEIRIAQPPYANTPSNIIQSESRPSRYRGIMSVADRGAPQIDPSTGTG